MSEYQEYMSFSYQSIDENGNAVTHEVVRQMDDSDFPACFHAAMDFLTSVFQWDRIHMKAKGFDALKEWET